MIKAPLNRVASLRASLPTRLRVLGVLPLAFFTAHLSAYWRSGEFGNMLWICTISNLVLSVALFFSLRWVIRLAVIWLIPGLLLWLYYLSADGDWLLTSFFTHIGGLSVGLFALHRIGGSRWAWLHASIYFLIIQQLSRIFTAPELNVNVAHSVYAGWEGVFISYWQYWLATTAGVVVGLWLLGIITLRIFPRPEEIPLKAAAPLFPD